MTLACLCGGLIEGLVFAMFAAFTWVASRFNLRRAARCPRKCCAGHSTKPSRSG